MGFPGTNFCGLLFLSTLLLLSLKSAYESGLCKHLITMVYGELLLGQVVCGDHSAHTGLSQDSRALTSGFSVAAYRATLKKKFP